MGKAKQWCTLTRVSSLVYRENKTVTVLHGYLRARWILSSGNYAYVSDALARSTIDNGSPAEHLGNTFRECNILSGFTLAFV